MLQYLGFVFFPLYYINHLLNGNLLFSLIKLLLQLPKLENHVDMFKYCVVPTICCGLTSKSLATFHLFTEFINWEF